MVRDQHEIFESISSSSGVFKINGAAGSGKTLLAGLLLCNVYRNNDKGSVLYITKSKGLVSEITKQIDGLLGDSSTAMSRSNMVLQTYDEFCQYIGLTKERSDFEDFRDWIKDIKEFSNYTKTLKITKQKDVIRIAQEIYEDIRKLYDSEGSLGKKQSYNHSVSQVVLTLYQKYLKVNDKINLELINLDDINMHNQFYDYIIVDEAQDFGKSALNFIISCLSQDQITKITTGSICFFIDTNQSLVDDFNLTSDYIKMLSWSRKMELTDYKLTYNYRTPQLINDLANHIMKMKNILIGGVISKDADLDIKTENDDPLLLQDNTYDGNITWVNSSTNPLNDIDDNSKNVLDILKKESKDSLELAVIIPDQTLLTKAIAMFPDSLIFTPTEIKGLEFKKIVFFNFISGKYTNNSITLQDINYINASEDKGRNNFPKDIEQAKKGGKHSQFFNNLFVGVTRSTNSLYFIEPVDNKTKAFKSLIGNYLCKGEDTSLEHLSLLEQVIKLEKICEKKLSSNIIEKYCKKIYTNIEISDADTEEKIICLNKIKNILESVKSSSDIIILIEKIIKTLESISSKETEAVNGYVNRPIPPPQLSPADSSRSKLENPARSYKTVNTHKASETDNSLLTTSISDILTLSTTIDGIKQLISTDQLQYICFDDQSKSTTLCILTQLPIPRKLLSDYVIDKSRKVFIPFLSEKALNHYNEKGISALYNLVTVQVLENLWNKLAQKKEFVQNIDAKGLSRIGPSGFTPIHLIYSKLPCIITKLLDDHINNLCKKDANLKKMKSIKIHSGGLPPLLFAAQKGHVEDIRLLLDNGAQVDSHDQRKATALHFAAQKGDIPSMEVLVNNGAQVNARTNFELTPLHPAATCGQVLAIKFLLSKGAQVDDRTKELSTPLHFAAQYGHGPTIQLLIDEGADKDTQNSQGHTPLHAAAQYGQVSAMESLLSNGADKNAQNAQGLTPLQVAYQYGHKDAVNPIMIKYNLQMVNPPANQNLGDIPQRGPSYYRDRVRASRVNSPTQGFSK